MYEIDFKRLLGWLTITFLRKPRLLAMMRVYCYPLIKMHQEFIAYRRSNLYLLSHNSRVCSIENVLNDRFDVASRRIYITNGQNKERIYIYTPLENKPLYLGKVPLYNPGDYAGNGVDFIVWVPMAVFVSPQDLIEMTALVNRYRLAGKRFQIYRV